MELGKEFFDDIDLEFEAVDHKDGIEKQESVIVEKTIEAVPLKETPKPTETIKKEESKTTAKEAKTNSKAINKEVKKTNTVTITNDETKKLKKENEELKLKLQNVEAKDMIVVDAQNTDDRKKVEQLMAEGKYIVDTKNKPFILSEYFDAITKSTNPVIHKVYCDEIESVSARRYYVDLENVIPESRELITETFWVKHKGYYSIDMITRKQLEYLIENNFVNEADISVTYVDRSTSIAYPTKKGKVPTLDDILDEKERLQAVWDSAHPKKKNGSVLPSNLQLTPEEMNNIQEHES